MDELYREHILDHYKHPRNAGRLEGASLVARELNPSCGDSIELFLKLDGCDRVEAAAFEGRGCAVSQASASLLTERLKGRPLAEIMALDEKDVLGLLGIEVGPMRMKCAMLPLRALRSALEAKSQK
jgi:nitrogen fixation NifU-like protein